MESRSSFGVQLCGALGWLKGMKTELGWHAMKWWDRVKEAVELEKSGGFVRKVRYVGGHPELIEECKGDLTLGDDSLDFDGMTGWLQGREDVGFSIPAEDILNVDYLDKDALKNAPEGYFAPLPIPWLAGYGSQRKQPNGMKLLSTLTVKFRDRHGDEQAAVFVNVADSPIKRDVANRIGAAAYNAKD